MRNSTFRACCVVLTAYAAGYAQTPAELFRPAQARETAGDLAGAERLYRGLLRVDPRSAEACANLGVVLAGQGRYSAAVEQYSRALRIKPALNAVHINLGLALLKSGQAAKAASEFTEYLGTDSGDRRVRNLLANAYLESDRYSEAARIYESLLPGDAGIRLGLGAAYARLGDRTRAEEQFTLALSSAESAATQLAIGQAWMGNNDFERAEAALRRALTLDARLPGIHFTLGALHWKQQRTPEAILEWERELAVDPRSFEASFALGAALVESKNELRGEPYLRDAHSLRPEHAGTLYYLGRLAIKRGSPEGIQLLEQSVRAEPANRAAHYLLAQAYRSEGNTAAATRHFAVVESLGRKRVEEDIDILESARR